MKAGLQEIVYVTKMFCAFIGIQATVCMCKYNYKMGVYDER